MNSKWTICCLILIFNSPLCAFQCYINAMKDSCWLNYDVTIKVINTDNNEPLTTILIPKGKSWVREAFSCEAKQVLSFQASYSPVFWQSDKGKVYEGQHYWSLPNEPSADEIAWILTLCYPTEFSEVPLPPDATGHCVCQPEKIPEIKGTKTSNT